jgi:hypothetical protein
VAVPAARKALLGTSGTDKRASSSLEARDHGKSRGYRSVPRAPRDLQPGKRPRPSVAYQRRGQLISVASDRADYRRVIEMPSYDFCVKRDVTLASGCRRPPFARSLSRFGKRLVLWLWDNRCLQVSARRRARSSFALVYP